jgi:phosphoribosylformimino-5-aminoimidazole carboxamide ribotide isomerase
MALTVIPSIDLRGGCVVRLKQGDYGRQITYEVDPVEVAAAFAEAGAQWMHIVDLDGAKEGRPAQTNLIARVIASTKPRVEVGGGVRTTADIQQLLDAGAARVVVGTAALENWEWFQTTVHQPQFAGKLILALDAKEGVVTTRGWTHDSGVLAADLARRVSDWPLGAILYTDVARDGMFNGPNFEQTGKLAEAGKVPVIASGGVGDLSHIQRLTQMPVWGVIVGRSLYEGRVNLHEALDLAAKST